MKLFAVSVRRAAFGWPLFATWNLVAHTREQQGTVAKVKTALLALLVIILTTGLWAAFWLTTAWPAWRLVNTVL
jgi:hypothetical protein